MQTAILRRLPSGSKALFFAAPESPSVQVMKPKGEEEEKEKVGPVLDWLSCWPLFFAMQRAFSVSKDGNTFNLKAETSKPL